MPSAPLLVAATAGPRAGRSVEARASSVASVDARRRRASPGSVSRLASPMRSASSPLTPRPVRMRSSACECPIRRGQPDRAAVDERHAPAPAEHAEHRVARRDAQVAPQRELEPARHRVALDRGDHGLRRAACASAPSGRRRRRCTALPRPSPTAFRSAPAQNVPLAPVRIATSCVVVGVERAERVGEQRRRSGRSTALRAVRPIDRHDGDRSVVLDDHSSFMRGSLCSLRGARAR